MTYIYNAFSRDDITKNRQQFLKLWLSCAKRHVARHVTCQKYQFYFKLFRTLKPNYVLNVVPLPFVPSKKTNKLFLPVKAFDPVLKLLEHPSVGNQRILYFEVMVVRDIKLRSRLSKNIHLPGNF